MAKLALRMNHVYKKFYRGETFGSLRDLIPAAARRILRQRSLNQREAREFWALQDVSFEVEPGEALGIIGHNGAGKSTILKILSRIMRPTAGDLIVNGRLSALIEISAGFHHDLTGRENIFLNGAILGMKRREIEAKLDQIIAFSGIEEFIDTPVKRYSSGMSARLGFSIAAHINPDVMIVDEVLSVGDYAFQQKCITRMREVIKSGAAVLFVSHNLKSVSEFCRKSILLERGKIVASGATEEVVGDYLNRSRDRNSHLAEDKAAFISRVSVRNKDGECSRFISGESAWIDIEIIARRRCSRLSVTLYIVNEEHESIFDTSTERLGHGSVDLETGEGLSCTFELHLNFGSGTFHPSVLLYRYDTETEFDRQTPAGTVYISTEADVGGVVNCFPSLTRREIRTASHETVATPNQEQSSQVE